MDADPMASRSVSRPPMPTPTPTSSPESSWWVRLVGLGREDSSPRNIAVTAAVIVLAVATVRPIGGSGTPLAVLLLLILNCALLATRVVPARHVDDRLRLVLLWSGVIASAALIALGRSGASSVFGFFVAGHAGYRFASSRSVPIALACSISNGGVLVLGWGGGHWFTPWWVGGLTGISVAAGMISRGRQQVLQSAMAAADSAERAAQAEAKETIAAERGRIARDVHDVLAHSLAGINMQLNLANALLDKGDVARAREITGRVQTLARDSLQEAQRTVKSLRDDALPLVETVRAMAASATPPASVDVLGPVRDVPGDLSQPLVRVTQEALTNAHKHAPGSAVDVRLVFEDGSVGVEIVNGPRDPAMAGVVDPVSGTGMGLVGMRERMRLVGGHVNVGPVMTGPAAGGWCVRAVVPTAQAPAS